MTKSSIITVIFIVLTLLVLGVFWYIQSQSTAPTEEEYTSFPNLEVADIKSVDDFRDLVQADSPEHKAVVDAIYTDVYHYFSCKENNNESKALILIAKYSDQNGVNTYKPAVATFDRFESHILQDWGEVLFPDASATDFESLTFTTQPINDEHIAATEYRIGESTNKKYNVYYSWVLNYIVVATDKNCLLATLGGLYDVH